MLETIINDVLSIIRATFLTGDWIGLLIAFGSVLIATVVMRRGTQIGSMTLLALILFAVGGYLRGVFAGPTPPGGAISGSRLVSQLEASWASFMTLQASMLLAYFIAFMALILILFGVKAVLGRG
ncbi:MAG: hypothetical protein ACE5FO_00125 [Parvularculaceae bacterium]